MKQFTLQEQQLNLQEQEDNIAAAREVGIEVQATIRNYNDPLPANLIDRFITKKEYLKLGSSRLKNSKAKD